MTIAATAALIAPMAVHSSASASASASATGGGDSVVLGSSGSVAAAQARPPAISCKLRVHQPHYSHHAHAANKHRVNVTANVKCTSRVAGLRIKVRLLKNGRNYKTSGWRTNAGKASISQNAARRCIKRQNYRGEAWATVTFPPGYRPPALSGHVKSKVVFIARCAR